MKPHPLDRLLARHPFCAGMDADDVAFLTGCATNVRFADGELIARHGELADHAWLIREGRVQLLLQGIHAVETVEAGELMGWSWLFPPYQWQFDARAIGRVRAIELSGICLRNKCQADPSFGYDLVRRILRQAHRRLEHSRMHALDIYGGGS